LLAVAAFHAVGAATAAASAFWGKAQTALAGLRLLALGQSVCRVALAPMAAVFCMAVEVLAVRFKRIFQAPGVLALFALSGPATHDHSHPQTQGICNGTLYSYC